VIINTGWNKLWAKDNARYVKSCPGIGEVSPNPDPQLSLPVHQIALVVNGVHLLENLKLDELAQKQVYEFAFVMQPLKMQGGSGSTVAPIAVR
jgi:kynurenine formamidase